MDILAKSPRAVSAAPRREVLVKRWALRRRVSAKGIRREFVGQEHRSCPYNAGSPNPADHIAGLSDSARLRPCRLDWKIGPGLLGPLRDQMLDQHRGC